MQFPPLGLGDFKQRTQGTWVAQSVKYLPSVQVMVPGSWVRVTLGSLLSGGICLRLSLFLCPHPCSRVHSLIKMDK